MTAPLPPRRLLALSGGGVRGVIEVAFLEAVEKAYQARHGPDTRLCDVFDLVGGTSTGAIIATALSVGHSMERIKDFYLVRARRFFEDKRWWRFGRAPVFDCAGLEAEFRRDVGDLTLGDDALQTYLAIVIKRLDTGDPWIVSNIPSSPYFHDPADRSFRGNKHFQLARLLRATTAAPLFFSQQYLELDDQGTKGVFVDGGLSPFNDPSMALLKLARMRAFGLNWPLGADNMFILSLGAGRWKPRIDPAKGLAMGPARTLLAAVQGLSLDMQEHTLTMMEWMGTSPQPAQINPELGCLSQDALTDDPLFTYLRMDLPLMPGGPLGLTAPEAQRLTRVDDASIIAPLYELATEHCAKTWDLERVLR